MNQELISKPLLVFSVVSALVVLVLWISMNLLDSRVKVVFCDVGQGDASYIRIPPNIDILIDAGSDKAVLRCLGKYMPFYDRTIELALLTHPHDDHAGGFNLVVDRYQINTFLAPPVTETGENFTQLSKKLTDKHIHVAAPLTGDSLHVSSGKAQINFIWPTDKFLKDRTDFSTTSFFGTPKAPDEDLNNYSLIFTFLLTRSNTQILYTGDATPEVLDQIDFSNTIKGPVSILKMPHHGSVNGLTLQALKQINPFIAVISAGKKNKYKHPSPEILEMLKAEEVPFKRTDEDGDIVFYFNEDH